jgi:hypothetical protein
VLHLIHLVMAPTTWQDDIRTGVMSYPSNSLSTSGESTFTKSVQVADKQCSIGAEIQKGDSPIDTKILDR